MKEIEDKIKELQNAINKTSSVYLKRDYAKAIAKLKKKRKSYGKKI